MQILDNTTPYRAEPFVSTNRDGVKSCVVVVKATFDVAADGQCRPAEEQAALVYRDDHYGEPGTTSIRYEADFSPVKPRIDVLVVGQAVSPGGRPVIQLDVSLVGPGLNKRVRVIGEREWVEAIAGVTASSPRPFATMPLVWERSFGGSDLSDAGSGRNGSELRNLVGRGFHINDAPKSIFGRPLPNLERPNEPMSVWSDKPEPIGFGSLGRGWQPRIRFAGTYDQRWMDERLPFLPEDFDDRYFQSAPLDQQLAEIPEGAALGCANMSETGRFVARVPAFAIPIRFVFEERIESATLRADTLILEPDRGRLLVAGRASARLPRRLVALRGIEVGIRRRVTPPWKPHYGNLGEALSAKRRSK